PASDLSPNGGEHDDRGASRRWLQAQSLADGVTVDPLHHQVQHHKVGQVAVRLQEGVESVERGQHVITMLPKIERKEFNKIALVIDDQNSGAHFQVPSTAVTRLQ